MKIVRRSDAQKFENADTCTAYEYDTGNSAINIARIEVSGRYPVEGSARNTEVSELVYVESGTGKVCINGTSHDLETGDVILIEKGESVWWEGIFTLIISCTPAWTPEQYEVHQEV